MSWQDRDYARGASYEDGWRSSGGGLRRLWNSSVVSRLMITNIAVYILCVLTAQRGIPLSSPLYEWGVLAYEPVRQGQLWRLFTPIFLHAGFMHLALNMFSLWMFGGPVESRWGPRTTLLVFLVSAVLGNLVYLFLVVVGFFPSGFALGASGGVLAIMGAAAVLMPRMRVYFYGILGVPLGGLAIVWGAGYLLNVWQQGPNAGGDACHLVGLICGAVYAWAYRSGLAGGGRQAVSRVIPTTRRKEPPSFLRLSEVDRDRLELDDLLRKVHDHGLESLSPTEHRRLTEITQRLRSDFE